MSTDSNLPDLIGPSDCFVDRHVGPRDAEIREMLGLLGYRSLDEMIDATIPAAIRLKKPLNLGPPRGEREALEELRGIARQNQLFRSLIGMGYYGTITPPVILRNVLENPGWYTQYTPYQAEISQGRLEALMNFQTMVCDLTALPLANASLLDEATAAAEAMTMCARVSRGKSKCFFVAQDCHPQTIAVVQTRARPLGFEVVVGDPLKTDFSKQACFGALLQYPTTDGRVECYEKTIEQIHAAGGLAVVATDLLALTLLKPPGEFGADIAIGSSQRFGVPMGFGGPHAAFMATRTEYTRQMPGRLIGMSKDADGGMGFRLTLQTREQHIRREKATSNICTAQVLLAIMAGMYATYHGPAGLRRIGSRVFALTHALRTGLRQLGHEINDAHVRFDTLRVKPVGRTAGDVIRAARERRINLRDYGDGTVGVSLDETTDVALVQDVLAAFGGRGDEDVVALAGSPDKLIPAALRRTSPYLSHPVFNSYHAEHEMLRYIKRLESRDLSLCQSMIPLGSCTMKLNAAAEMLPITWPEFAYLHPFAPVEQAAGYIELFRQLEGWLAEITGFAAVSLQPNSGAAGEYAGLMVIRAYHQARGEGHRNVCLIPVSAHGTNPASSAMAGYQVVPVACDEHGNIDVADLKRRAEENRDKLAALMITYPSTHGVFEEAVRELCQIVHANGGQVYMDGANMNAQVGLCRPGDIGADICHLNLHKTFSIPHGGGGPGVGPIACAEHLKPYLPGHPVVNPAVGRWECGKAGTACCSDAGRVGAVAAAPFGSPSILPISWMYIRMMGEPGLKKATQVAILNANYMAHRLREHYPIYYAGKNGRVAHEFILDCRELKKAHVEVEDIAKRLMDFGFHAPTMSWPVHDTLMIEPTESESKQECDRLVEALIAIKAEAQAIAEGRMDAENNPLKNAPHTARAVTATEWNHPYSREQAAFPTEWLRHYKFWPPVARIDNVHGDRHLCCACPADWGA